MSTTTSKTTRKKNIANRKYDSAWKSVLRQMFKDFLEFFFPDIYNAVDFRKEVVFLDKELKEIDPDSSQGDRKADVLVKVHLKDGSTRYICIIAHIEVQGQPKANFMERMFIYFYRAYDKEKKEKIPVISAAVLTDNNPEYRPDEFRFELFGFQLYMKIPMVKIIDFKLNETLKKKLETSTNPMTMVVKAQLKSHEVMKADDDTKFEVTKELIRECYKNGYSKEETRLLLKFVAWVIRLPENYKDGIMEVMKKAEEEFKMEFIPLFEIDAYERGEKEGIKEGIKKGERKGEKKGKLETAKRMLMDNWSIENVMKYTGLSEKEVKSVMN